MDKEEFEETIAALKEEFQGFLTWVVGELGEEYFIDDLEHPSSSWEEDARKKISGRVGSERVQWWERDWHAFFDDPQHPSIYKILEVEDLELLHYLEEFDCDHSKAIDMVGGGEEANMVEVERSYEQAFGVLLASQQLGWMYRLDFCGVCGLIEVWSMEYNSEEVTLYSGISRA